MCGRFTREYTWQQVWHAMQLVPARPAADLPPSYNIAPTHQSAIVRSAPDAPSDTPGEQVEGVIARFGLIPSWAKDASIASSTINARSETADTKPAFRHAFASQRCVVPVTRFYEWAPDPHGGPKQPYSIHRADGEVMLLAGLWESWRDPAAPDDPVLSFSILTVAANPFLAGMHDRMPAILEPHQARRWIAPGPGDKRLLSPAADGVLDMHPVGRAVNRPARNDPSLIEPIEPDAGLFG